MTNKPYIHFKNSNQITWESSRDYNYYSKDNKELIRIMKVLIKINGQTRYLEGTFTCPKINGTHYYLLNNMN